MMFLDCFFFQIIDEKSLIKKYQKEISTLKEELDQLRKGVLAGVSHEEIMTLRQKVVFQLTLSVLLVFVGQVVVYYLSKVAQFLYCVSFIFRLELVTF